MSSLWKILIKKEVLIPEIVSNNLFSINCPLSSFSSMTWYSNWHWFAWKHKKKKEKMSGIYIGVFTIPFSIFSATWRPNIVSFCFAYLAVYNSHCEEWEHSMNLASHLQCFLSDWDWECACFLLTVKFNSRHPCCFWNYVSSVQCDSLLLLSSPL